MRKHVQAFHNALANLIDASIEEGGMSVNQCVTVMLATVAALPPPDDRQAETLRGYLFQLAGYVESALDEFEPIEAVH